MTFAKWIAQQLGRPGQITGWMAGLVWNYRNAALNESALAQLNLQPDDRLLDVGFGGGYLLRRAAVCVRLGRLEGVDLSPAVVASAQRRFTREIRSGRLALRCGSVEELPYPDAAFTKVCSVNSIFYWQDARQGLRELFRVLRPDGKVVLCFTCKESLEQKRFARNLHLYDPETVISWMAAVGFADPQPAFFSDRYRRYVTLAARKKQPDSEGLQA